MLKIVLHYRLDDGLGGTQSVKIRIAQMMQTGTIYIDLRHNIGDFPYTLISF